MEIVNVLLGADGWGCKKRGGEFRLMEVEVQFAIIF